MAMFAKPENALKRAEELINVGQKQAALQALHDVITSKRYRAWQKPLERIMFKYVELCVDLRKGRFAKDGLIQYRIVCQQVNVSSLEEVIKHFMHLSTERAEQARSQAQALEDALDVDDLEADKRPEDLMMSYVSGEKGKDRSDREVVTPWFKFLWETYRTVLEILRNNSKLEALYAMTAHRAFQFCKQYKRTTEFRRLCEIIRNHLSNLNKYKDQRDRPDLSAPESLQLYLDTRFEQLKIATELYLWQEAFRSVEDIYGLMSMVKQTPKSSSLVVYYAKLTEIFWVSDSHLYHAYAWLKLFVLQKTHNKKLKQEALQLIASSVLLSAMSVSPFDNSSRASHMELENEKERNLRMASLIGFNFDQKRSGREVLSRSSLLAEVVSEGVMRCVPQEVKDLYHLLEQEVLPSELESKVQPLLTKISSIGGRLASASSVPEVHLAKYVPALEKLATLRVLQQVSKVYQTMKIEVLSRMIPFFEFSQVEKIAVDAAKHNFLGMKVDHHEGGVFFENMDLESDNLQHHLAILAANLNKARNLIIAHPKKDSKVVDSIPDLAEIVDKEHKRLLARKSIIEKRKEEQERQMLEMEHKQESLRIEHQKILEEAEKKRLESESNKRKQLRIQLEIEERELEEAQALLLEAERRSKKKGKKPILDGEKVTKQTLIDMALNEQLKERQEMEKKLQKLAKTLDYMERAKREEEAPLVEAAYQQRIVEGKYVHEQEQLNEIELSRLHHAGDLQQKYRLSRMVDNKTMFAQRILSQREAEYRRLRQESEERIQQIRDEQKRDRIARRKLLFYLKSEEDRLTRLREEEEARKHEESERKKKEEAEKKAYLDKVAEKQKQREKELEEKELQRREMLLGKSADTRPTELTSAVPPTAAPAGPASPAAPAAPAAPASPAAPAAPAGPAAPAPSTGKYVPRFRMQGVDNAPAAAPPAEPDRWGRHGDRPPQDGRWRSSNTSRSSSSWSSARRP